jgi:excinuclease UvrABC nuclease subunit
MKHTRRWQRIGTRYSKHKLPSESGVYVIYLSNLDDDTKKVLYVGSTNNAKKRFSSHRIYAKLFKKYLDYPSVFLEVKFKKTNNYKDLEKNIIPKLKPKLNKVYNWGYDG